jgi:hypothetical protein
LPRDKTPLPLSLHPDICVAAINGFSCIGRTSLWDSRFPPRHDDSVSMNQDGFRLSNELRIGNSAGAYLIRSIYSVERIAAKSQST